ncbi:hypothetical protein SNE40_022701 [Patella caerulea]
MFSNQLTSHKRGIPNDLEKSQEMYYGKRSSDKFNHPQILTSDSTGVPITSLISTLFQLLQKVVDENGDDYLSSDELNVLQK